MAILRTICLYPDRSKPQHQCSFLGYLTLHKHWGLFASWLRKGLSLYPHSHSLIRKTFETDFFRHPFIFHFRIESDSSHEIGLTESPPSLLTLMDGGYLEFSLTRQRYIFVSFLRSPDRVQKHLESYVEFYVQSGYNRAIKIVKLYHGEASDKEIMNEATSQLEVLIYPLTKSSRQRIAISTKLPLLLKRLFIPIKSSLQEREKLPTFQGSLQGIRFCR